MREKGAHVYEASLMRTLPLKGIRRCAAEAAEGGVLLMERERFWEQELSGVVLHGFAWTGVRN